MSPETQELEGKTEAWVLPRTTWYPQSLCSNSGSPGPANVTLFEDRILPEVTKLVRLLGSQAGQGGGIANLA